MGGFLACILAGAAMSIQGVMNTCLSEHIGTMETNAFVQCVAAVLSLLVLVFWRTGSFAALAASCFAFLTGRCSPAGPRCRRT